MTEEIYQNLVRTSDKTAPESIHLCAYPVADDAMIDRELEAHMDEVLRVVALGRACRNAASVKNRQPIGKMYVKAEFSLPDFFCEIIEEELNVKAVVFSDSVRDFTTYTFKPNLRTVGPKFGKFLGGIRTALTELDGNAAMDEIEASGRLSLSISGEAIALEREDLLIEMTKKDGFESLSDHGVTVVIDKNLTPELIEEGFVREIISKIQTMRKDSGFEVMDRIRVAFSGNEAVLATALRNAEEIKDETLADTLSEGTLTFAKEWNINGEKVTLSVEKV
jgi:isoleucyl-tRNA synthetase